jgi:antitoxin Phd
MKEVAMCRTSIYDARNNFSALVKAAEEGEVVELTRYDKPVAVIISYEEYEKRNSKKEDWLGKWREEYADVLDDKGFDITPSRECPDYSKDPWA